MPFLFHCRPQILYIFLCWTVSISNVLHVHSSSRIAHHVKPYKSAHEIYTRTSRLQLRSSITDIHGTDCDDLQHACFTVHGLYESGNPEINDRYCVYECVLGSYIKFQAQTTCAYFLEWVPDHYVIYSHERIRTGTVSNHLFASARDCDHSLKHKGYEYLTTCNFWNVFDKNDDIVTVYNVSVTAIEELHQNQCTTSTGVVDVKMDRGEVAAIVIIILAVFVVSFGGCLRYH
mmetsp:Transcript_23231/g.37217  ORF Transcript_23231/g.37217 Transcript_23231/m.37217 type:complete len:232 (-) Transcript_23231:2-697(-)